MERNGVTELLLHAPLENASSVEKPPALSPPKVTACPCKPRKKRRLSQGRCAKMVAGSGAKAHLRPRCAEAEDVVARADAGLDFAVVVAEDVVGAELALRQKGNVPVAEEDVLPLEAVVDAVSLHAFGGGAVGHDRQLAAGDAAIGARRVQILPNAPGVPRGPVNGGPAPGNPRPNLRPGRAERDMFGGEEGDVIPPNQAEILIDNFGGRPF